MSVYEETTKAFQAAVGYDLQKSRGERLNAYCRAVFRAYSHIRLLLLPQDNAPVQMKDLFVEPHLSPRPLRAGEEAKLVKDVAQAPTGESVRFPLLEAVAAHQRLVVLGDPGSGKSTLIQWIASQLAMSNPDPWKEALARDREPPIPIPMILRDLGVTASVTWDSLLASFLKQPFLQKLDHGPEALREALETALKEGRAFVMLDGIDEIGSVTVRQALCAAVLDGMAISPNNRWLLTSRPVGYNSVPFDVVPAVLVPDALAKLIEGEFAPKRRSKDSLTLPFHLDLNDDGSSQLGIRVTDLLHVAPFTQAQVAQYSHYWFRQRDFSLGRAHADSQRFCERIKSHPSTDTLSRNPQFLSLMALLYRVKAYLPEGRARLYMEITHAYLESIDRSRQLPIVEHQLEQKVAWLARVGFEIQYRRAEPEFEFNEEAEPEDVEDFDGEVERDPEILATEADILAWVGESMREMGTPESGAPGFVEWVKRRSGLLVNRGSDKDGKDLYAFLHLSFQEFFAAVHLKNQMLDPDWKDGILVPPRCALNDLRSYVSEPLWRETLVFLFELLPSESRWPQRLLALLFGEKGTELLVPDGPSALLLAAVATDSAVGMPDPTRDGALRACWYWAIQPREGFDFSVWQAQKALVSSLTGLDPEPQARAWRSLADAMAATAGATLDLSGTQVSDLSPLAGLANLQTLRLDETLVSDLSPLAGLASLQTLSLTSTQVSDLSPLAGLVSLRWLELGNTLVSDLSPLAGLVNLQWLYLRSTQVSDLSPLASLASLQGLYLHSTDLTHEEIDAFQAERERRGLPTVNTFG